MFTIIAVFGSYHQRSDRARDDQHYGFNHINSIFITIKHYNSITKIDLLIVRHQIPYHRKVGHEEKKNLEVELKLMTIKSQISRQVKIPINQQKNDI